jgi:hypothetical protein
MVVMCTVSYIQKASRMRYYLLFIRKVQVNGMYICTYQGVMTDLTLFSHRHKYFFFLQKLTWNAV